MRVSDSSEMKRREKKKKKREEESEECEGEDGRDHGELENSLG